MAQPQHPLIVLASSDLNYILIRATLNRLLNRRLRIGFLKAGEEQEGDDGTWKSLLFGDMTSVEAEATPGLVPGASGVL